MRVLKEQGSPLVDAEVFEWLNDCETQRRRRRKRRRDDLDTSESITYQEKDLHAALKTYLEKMPAKTQKSKLHVSSLFGKLDEYSLAPAEKLMLANHRPDKLVHVNAIIRDCDKRLPEEQVDKILELVIATLPDPPVLLEERDFDAEKEDEEMTPQEDRDPDAEEAQEEEETKPVLQGKRDLDEKEAQEETEMKPQALRTEKEEQETQQQASRPVKMELETL